MSQVVAKASRLCWVQASSWLSSTTAHDSREARKWPQAPSTDHPACPLPTSSLLVTQGQMCLPGLLLRKLQLEEAGWGGGGVSIQSRFFLDAWWGVPLISFLPHPPWDGPVSGGDGRGEALPTSSSFTPCSPSPPQPFPSSHSSKETVSVHKACSP